MLGLVYGGINLSIIAVYLLLMACDTLGTLRSDASATSAIRRYSDAQKRLKDNNSKLLPSEQTSQMCLHSRMSTNQTIIKSIEIKNKNKMPTNKNLKRIAQMRKSKTNRLRLRTKERINLLNLPL